MHGEPENRTKSPIRRLRDRTKYLCGPVNSVRREILREGDRGL
jgi:hypothetical protein